ncbi:MAG: histidine triad nucleotide-binding protein [bacterium]|nr:histidine triad nucleotide-binding protein [bacterium]
MDCLFCRIAAKEISAAVRYEDDRVLAFDDIHPQSPTHVLVIPKRHVAALHEVDDDALAGALVWAVRAIVADAGIAQTGYRVVTNAGEHGGQEVAHLHLHILGGRQLGAMG